MTNHSADLWLSYCDPQTEISLRVVSQLNAAQLDRANKFAGKRKREYILGRLLLSHALAQRNSEQNWEVIERENLPPLIAGPVVASISHSKGWLGVLMTKSDARTKVGLDIELVRRSLRREAGAYFCNEQQLALLDTISQPDQRRRYLTRLWTQKEAFFKSQELPVLNQSTKATDFSDDQRMQSAALGNSFELSAFCSDPFNVTTHFLTLNKERGKFLPTAPTSLVWCNDQT